MRSAARTVAEYLDALPDDRRLELQAVRRVLLANLGAGFEEGMQYGMIGYYVPHRLYPAGYHCDPRQPLPFAGLASQKNHLSLYLMCEYVQGDAEGTWLRERCAARGLKLDMGKACIRFKRASELPLDLIGQAVSRVSVESWVRVYEASLDRRPRSRVQRGAQTKAKATTAKRTKATKGVANKAKAARPRAGRTTRSGPKRSSGGP